MNGGNVFYPMECFDCGNCKNGSMAYMSNEKRFYHERGSKNTVMKTRSGWKRTPNYETYRRKNRKEIESITGGTNLI